MDQPLHAREEQETRGGDSMIKDGHRRMPVEGMTAREAQNSLHCGRRDGGWGHWAHVSLEGGDLSTPGCVALKPLILDGLSTASH